MESRSRSMLFLMEQMIAIIVFAFCAAVCVRIIAEANILANHSNDMKNAIIVSENGAECFKAFSGDPDKITATLGGSYTGSKEDALITIYYDDEWMVSESGGAAYIMSIRIYEKSGDISVSRVSGDELISLKVSVRSRDG